MKDFFKDLKEVIDWILAGCPEPVKVPIKPKDGKNENRKQLHNKNR